MFCAAVLLLSCTRNEQREEVALPNVAPDTVVVSWSVVSRSSDRRSMHIVLHASRELITMSRSATGTMMSVARTVSEEDYAKLVGTLRSLQCCALPSSSGERSDPSEAKPQLEINFGDMQCEIELWDREWREGRARECGFAFALFHHSGFVPDPPVDEPSP
ncbi:MAG: hypothetical protein JRE45_00490 [Deltaproteobacteria bacterium]|nr:hypothetical protein [Deltaproteobacteria bacterium]MBW1873821.1 hypothetical protein [Deltaproteobacteria bacterium]MBW2626069.1 hypothetical protein [Deltaproteobacteria bacterium]